MLDIFDPIHNLKEICKEFVLLEDHLSTPEKQCSDCIRKHLLKAEAFAEEAIGLDKTGEHLALIHPLPTQIRSIQKAFLDGEEKHQIGQRVRKLRKRLSPHCFSANLKSDMQKKQPKGKKKSAESLAAFALDIAGQMGVTAGEKKKFVRALAKSASRKAPYFRFPDAGITARVRNSAKWVKAKAVELLSKGQVLKMLSRSQTNGSSFTEAQYTAAIRHAFGQGGPAHLDTPSSSIGEYLTNPKIKRHAIGVAMKAGLEGSLRRIKSLESGRNKSLRKCADLYTYIAKKTKEPYFFVQAARRYGQMGEKTLEARSFKQVLALDRNHPLKFWLGNKAIIADRIGAIEEEEQESAPKETSTLVKYLLPFVFGGMMGMM